MHICWCVHSGSCVCEQGVKQQWKPPLCEPGFSLGAPSCSSHSSASHYHSASTHPAPQAERYGQENIKDSQWEGCGNFNPRDVTSLLTWRTTVNTVQFFEKRGLLTSVSPGCRAALKQTPCWVIIICCVSRLPASTLYATAVLSNDSLQQHFITKSIHTKYLILAPGFGRRDLSGEVHVCLFALSHLDEDYCPTP